MVEQTQTARRAYPARRSPSGKPRTYLHSATLEEVWPETLRRRLLLIVVVALFIPGTINVAGTVLSPYRVVLLGLLPLLCWRWISGVAGRPLAADILVLLGTAWSILSLLVNHGTGILPRCAIVGGEIFGAYLIGRMLILNKDDFRTFFRYMTIMYVILLPFLLVEWITGFNALRKLFDIIFTIPARQHNLGRRLGFERAQGTFEHPILFGLIASLCVANVFYIHRHRFPEAYGRVAFAIFTVFMSMSSGPMLSVLVQMILTGWDRMLAAVKGRWVMFVYVAIFVFLLLRIASQFNLLDFVIEHLMFNSQSAGGRLIILEYGTKITLEHPVFGIGLNDWERPWWRAGKGSFDNFWLLMSVRYGIPTLAFLVAAWIVSFTRIALKPGLSEEEADYRRGYLIALIGLGVVLGTVYIWNATSVFVWLYVGAGAWFYASPSPSRGEESVLARRATQARAFEAAPPAPSAARATVPVPGVGDRTQPMSRSIDRESRR